MSDDDGLSIVSTVMNKSQIRKELYELPKDATFQVDKILELD